MTDDGIWSTWRQAPGPVRAILLGVFVNRLGAFFQTFLVLFLTHRGFSKFDAGLALTVYGVGSMLGVIAGGALADRLGPRLATLVSMGGSALMLLSVLYLHNYPSLLVAVALVGVIGQLYRPASATLLSQLTPKERQVMIFALYRWAMNLGTTAAPLMGAALILISYDLLFWAEAITAICYGAIAAVALPRRAPAAPAGQSAPKQTGYRAVLADRRYVLYLLAVLVNAIVYIQYVSTLPLTMHDAGLATVWFSVVVALNGFLVITCELLVTKVVQKLPIKLVVAAGFALLGGGLSLYALPWGVGIFLVGTLVWTLAEMVGGPTMFAYPGMVASDQLRGRYIGSMQLMFSLGSAIGPGLGVFAYDAIGLNVWWCCGLASLVALVLAASGMSRPVPESQTASVPESEPVSVSAPSPDVGTNIDTSAGTPVSSDSTPVSSESR
ncbi:MAG: MFS transporter [Actinomycetota bacterium]|nr:MFS transporter [Actinomycetota bacterium]MDQ2959128.1 MFS transporter [Actinomycetota bacterium]